MPPNHDSRFRNSQNTQRNSETTSTTNLPLESNHTLANDQPLFEKTFAIVQCVIFSLLGRKVNRIPSREAKKVRELTTEILAKHDVYNSLCLNLGFTPDNLEEMFYGVAENIFEDGLINWGRLIALLGFSVKVSEYFRSQGLIVNPDQIVELTTCFIVNKTGPWIQSKGGWVSIYFFERITGPVIMVSTLYLSYKA
jgi:hypothetical protein